MMPPANASAIAPRVVADNFSPVYRTVPTKAYRELERAEAIVAGDIAARSLLLTFPVVARRRPRGRHAQQAFVHTDPADAPPRAHRLQRHRHPRTVVLAVTGALRKR